jgi:MoxR-like ATPase
VDTTSDRQTESAGADGGESPGPARLDEIAETAEKIRRNVDAVIEGKTAVVLTSIRVLLSGGHLLVEDVPGVGKTLLSKALATSIDASMRRIQFTPDLLPSDLTGVSVFNQANREFEFRPGGIFANIVLGDEINRASPKTQAAMLEAMEERQVSVDGTTYRLPAPFMVIATQNPVEMEGTYALPEAERDRFTAKISLGYPSADAEFAMLTSRESGDPLDSIGPVTDTRQVGRLIAALGGVHAAPEVLRYIVDLCSATRRHTDLLLGASPRATLHLMRMARVVAVTEGRDYVVPDDVLESATAVLAHRLLPTPQATMSGRSVEDALARILEQTPVRT